jgi:anthranilate synthase/indole-3-glycerol phosphate synthase/phosphoribosylanthranilate isomerase
MNVAADKEACPPAALQARVASLYAAPPLCLLAALTAHPARLAVAAEFKRASPSKGDIVAPATPVEAFAEAYTLGGAAVVSVLTEPTWFKGSLADLENVRSALEGATLSPGVCALRKDFLIDEYMLLEARAHGADTALLLVAILTPEELVRLMAASRALGMEPLVEVNTEAEMRIALDAGAAVIGVNNRNLHTFEVDMGTTGRLAAMIPEHADVQLLALSGVATRQDALDLAATGACGVLVGESLMRQADVEAATRSLLGRLR